MANFENVTFMSSVVLVVTVACAVYCTWVFRYWKRRNVLCFEAPAIAFEIGLLLLKGKLVLASTVKSLYDLAKRKGWNHVGVFLITIHTNIVVHPDEIKGVLQQGFEHFPQRMYDTCKTDDAFAANIAFVSGERWRYLRAKLTPAFTPAKIKALFGGIIECAYQMQTELDSRIKKAVDVTHMSSCFFADVIGVSGYGLDCNSFKNPNSKFITHATKLIDLGANHRLIKVGLKTLFPKFSEWLGIQLYDNESSGFFIKLAKGTAKFRKNNEVLRKDLFQLMLDAETDLNIEEMDNEASNSAKIIKDVASQVFIFFVAGFETSSLTLMYCLYELAQNLTIQSKLREDIDRVLIKYEGKVTYDAIMEMKYLSQVVDETLRKYPPIPYITRKCMEDYKMSQTTIEKGMVVFVPVIGLHHDPDYYPDPEKFDPERFSEENKQKIIPFTYLPFGEGPKNCPAYRFGLMQIKVGLVVLLQHYIFLPNEKANRPIELAPGGFSLKPKSGILLRIQNRHDRE